MSRFATFNVSTVIFRLECTLLSENSTFVVEIPSFEQLTQTGFHENVILVEILLGDDGRFRNEHGQGRAECHIEEAYKGRAGGRRRFHTQRRSAHAAKQTAEKEERHQLVT